MSGDGVAGGAFMAGVHGRQLRQRRLCSARLRRESARAQHAVQRQPGQSVSGAGARGQSRPRRRPIPTHDPNGGLNSTFFYQPGNFNTAYDFSGDGKFEQSALYAALSSLPNRATTG